ncbi:MAG: hypothetical protein HY873_10885 [Chloroflexi bacterium]|nr:hypothetical protein [Chloroflexota bacterium]
MGWIMQGEIGYMVVALTALLIWSPALGAAFVVARVIHGRLRQRGVDDSTSLGTAVAASIMILVAYLPVYAFLIFSLFDWGVFPSGSE